MDQGNPTSRLERIARVSAPVFLLATAVTVAPAIIALEREPRLIDTFPMVAVISISASSFFLLHLCIAVWLLLKRRTRKLQFSLQSLLVLNLVLGVDLAILSREAYRSITLLALMVVGVSALIIVKLES